MAEDKSDFYQGKADQLRRLAGRMKSDHSRSQLIGIACLFEKLAARIRSREQERQAAD